ncbi:hypothetical protein C2845_PM06G08430 [Panicum miliaceum]|uniref:Uncharacterized protein n=1 Tax=Panicum miliaceum TaxID=4540 RepID=A0A3L6RC96_PANMI|nr:hypothetical protein C2845_PM06G08430 [Panicum miliaceum]
MDSLIGSGSAARLGCQRECQTVRNMAAWHPSEATGAQPKLQTRDRACTDR